MKPLTERFAMNIIDLNQVYSTYARQNDKWVIELTCDSLYADNFMEHLFLHLKRHWGSRKLADQIVTDLEKKSVSVYEFTEKERFDNFFLAVKGFNEYLYVVAYSPDAGKVYDSWTDFTFIGS